MDNNNKKQQQLITQKHFQTYELINKIQNVLNTESLLPQFIYFAKNMEEMRKKWHMAEMRCKDLEAKLNVEKSLFHRKINELQINIEVHNEKRLQAESRCKELQAELDKMHKQFELFKDILQSDKRSLISGQNTFYEDTRFNVNNILSTPYDLTVNNHQHHSETPFKSYHHQDLHMDAEANNQNEHENDNRRLTFNRVVEDTNSFNISDYTEDDIDLNENNELEMNIKQQQQAIQTQPSSLSLQQQNENVSNRKRNQRHSASLTRNGERAKAEEEKREKKRSRTRSTDINKQQQAVVTSSGGGVKAITAITTLQMDENGRPLTVTSEIKHNNPESIKQQHSQINANGNKMELSFHSQQQQQLQPPPIPPKQNRTKSKKRPSREFLQRSADESESTEDSELFWNGTDVVMDELTTKNGQSSNKMVHIMTPIVETPQRPAKRSNPSAPPHTMTPAAINHAKFKSLSANSIPLARKYKRPHQFKGQVILNSELCAHCDKRTKFGKMIMKCRECETVVHTECKDQLQRPCYPLLNFPSQGTISDYVITSQMGNDDFQGPHVPPVLQMIISEIESRGLLSHEVGLYRVNGSDSQIKQLKERLIKRHQPPDLRKINDVHVLCGFVKDFLNNFLTEHLITYDAWHRFAKACEIQNETDRLTVLEEAIQDLPEANRDTLSFMILHLQRISETPECKMPASNLARVFGPSLVGNSSPKPPAAEVINEIKIQHQIVENLIKIPSAFYLSFIDCHEVNHHQRLFKNNTNNLKTPDLMRKSKTAVVLSSILGPASNLPSQTNQNKF